MSAKYIWGWGGVKLTVPSIGTADYEATFAYAGAGLAFEPINVVYTTINQEQHVIHKGWRVKIRLSLVNACDTDYAEFLHLINVLNAGTQQGRDILIYPRHTVDDYSLAYNCRLTSGVDFATIAPVKSAQKIELEFESYEPVWFLPSLYSDVALGYLITKAGENVKTVAGEYIITRG